MVKRGAVTGSGTRVLTIPCKVSWLCAVITDDLSLTSTHASSSSSSSVSTVRIVVSSPRGVILRSVSFLLYFTLDFIYVSQPLMHKVIGPTIPIIVHDLESNPRGFPGAKKVQKSKFSESYETNSC
jgi:hypothetical protein